MPPHGRVARAAPVPDTDLAQLDVVCLSSFRPDHFERGNAQRLGTKTPLVSPPAVGEHGFEDARLLVHWATMELRKDEERLSITATPAHEGSGYFFRHDDAGTETTAYWTGDCLWSDAVRRVQRDCGYANLLIVHVGAEGGADGPVSPGGKEAMQIVYRMQPNAIVPVHYHTFSHYREPLDPFVDLLERTIYDRRLRVLREGESFEK
jgi:L-ascorbate metabolism protein UlaG (beta-lactamase superfamily)